MRAKTVKEMLNESINESRQKLENGYLLEYDDDDLNAAELRARNQGKDILTRAQMAACYLNAKNAQGRSEDARTNFAGKMARKMNKVEKETDFQKVSAPRLADMLNLSVRTVGYTVSKFRLLLDGNREGTESNVIYDKILYYFDLFEKMSPGEVHGLALEAIDPDASYERSLKFAEENREQYLRALAKKREEEKNKFNIINALTSAFSQYKPLGEERAAKAALKSIEAKYAMTHDELIRMIKASKIEQSLRKIFLAV